MEKPKNHTVISLKMVIGYCDSLFNETRVFLVNPNLFKALPKKLVQQYTELESQYALVERKDLNFYNILLLKKSIEAVTKEITQVSQKLIQENPENVKISG